jgi:hypothetical protein
MRNCLETQASKMKGHFTRRREPPLSVHSRDLEGNPIHLFYTFQEFGSKVFSSLFFLYA